MTTTTQTPAPAAKAPKLVITTSTKGSRIHLSTCKNVANAKTPASPFHVSPAVVAGATAAACCKPENAAAVIEQAGKAQKLGAESVALYLQTQDDSPAPAPAPVKKATPAPAKARVEPEAETPAEPKPMTRKQCLEALAAAGYTGPTSYLMPRLREIVEEQGALTTDQAGE